MDSVLIAFHSILILIHFLGIVIGFYTLLLDRISGINKQITYTGLASTSIPLFVSDIFILLTLTQKKKDYSDFTTSLDTYACLVFQLFFPQMVFCKMISIFSGISPKFYSLCTKFLELKVILLLLLGFGGLGVTQLSADKNYVPIFLTSLSFFGYSTCVLFLGAIYYKLTTLQIILNVQDNIVLAPRRSIGTTGSVSPSLSSESATVVKINTANLAFDKAKKEFKFSFFAASTFVPIYCIVALFQLAFYSDGSQRSNYILSISWKMACSLSTMNIPIGMILSKY